MEDREPTLSQVVNDECFCALLHDAQHAALTWDAFLAHPLPAHLSPLAAWKALEAIGHCAGIDLFPRADGAMLWYRRTSELDAICADVARRAAERTPLHEALCDGADRGLVLTLRLREAVGAALLGGLAFDERSLETHVRAGTEPADPAERLVANAVAVDADLEDYRTCPFSPTLLAALAARVTTGTAYEGSMACVDGVVSRQLDRLAIYVESDIADDLPVLRCLLVADTVRRLRPFGPASSLVGSLAGRLLALRWRLPALAFAPVAEARARWAAGLPDKAGGACTPQELAATLERSPADLTAFLTVAARCTAFALDGIEETLTASSEADAAVRAALQGKRELNHRQRSIVARALRTPHAEFRIRYHQRKHAISYATARRDLVELQVAGYLRVEQRGKTFVFLPGERIDQLIEELR